MATIRLANAPVSWGIMEVEGWSPRLPYAAFLDELTRAGYSGTELGPYGYLPADPTVLRQELERRSLALTSAFVPLRLKDPGADLSEARVVSELLRDLGARFLVLSDALWPEREAIAGRVAQSGVQLNDSQWRILTENIHAVSELASSFRLRCVFHHHAGTYIETPEELARLMESTGVDLCLDTGHYAYGGGDPVEAVRAFGRRVEYLHFKDFDPIRLEAARQAQRGFLDAVRAGVFCQLGSGCVRFPELLAALERTGYDGWAVVEQDIDATQAGAKTPFERARASREYLRGLGI